MKLKLPNFGSLCKENILVNGDFNCWQRGETFTIKGDEALHYTADMWCVYAGTGQTITVKKTTDGLQFRGTSVIMQRMSPLKVGQKYVFLCKVDGDVKTLSITGGTYTENSFLKYNKAGSYEQLQIKSNGTTNVASARLWEGDTVYKIVKEDDTIALTRSQDYIRQYDNMIFNITYNYSNKKFIVEANYPKMKKLPTFAHGACEMWSYDGEVININIESQSLTSTILTMKTAEASKDKKDGSYIIFVHNVVLSCEPL